MINAIKEAIEEIKKSEASDKEMDAKNLLVGQPRVVLDRIDSETKRYNFITLSSDSKS